MISYAFGSQTDDVSYGRNPDGSETWEYFSSPTPGASNVTENSPPGPFFILYPEYNDTLVINLENQNDSTNFSWEESVDPDGDSIQYIFQFYGLDVVQFGGADFTKFYEHTLDNTELSLANNFIADVVIDFYSDVMDGYFLDSLSESIPVWWGVTSSDGIDTYGDIDIDDLGYNNNGFVLNIDISGYEITEIDTPDVVINEFLAGSENCCGSDIFDGNTEDFVELYNYGTEPININGWGFSDTDGIITTTAPDTSIAPGNFLVLWYTGDNNGFPEINEKLSSDGEAIYIADADGNPMISYAFGSQTDDVSYGRYPDGSDFWETMHPTPGQSNMTNTSPGDFSLIFPLESDTLTTALVNQSDSLIFLDSIMFEWEESIDPDGNDIHYVFRLSIQCCGGYDMWSILDTLDVNNNSISYSSLYVILEGMFEQPMLFSTPHHINWGVKAIDGIDETTEITNSFYVIFNDYLDIDNEIIPKYFTVFPAYPNPFNPVTTLSYLIPIDGFVDVTIFDMMGRVIKNLVRSKQSYGYKSIKWNATDNQNQVVPAGVYVYKIEFGKFVSTRKMILLK